MGNIPEIIDKFCKAFQEMFSNREDCKSSLETAVFILASFLLPKQAFLVFLPKARDKTDINWNNIFCLLSTLYASA